jgi:CRISPR-associated protein Cas5d
MAMRQFILEVWGDFACFTHPELKTERYSYPVMTPSAARAIFDAIYIGFTPGVHSQAQFRWQVRRIEILSPIRLIDFTRNEVQRRISTHYARGRMRKDKAGAFDGNWEVDLGHTQRQTVALQDIRYRVHAEPILYNERTPDRQRIEHMFERRASRGRCVRQPYLGCREFVAFFELVTGQGVTPIKHSEEIGWVPYDVFDLSQPNSSSSKPSVSVFYARIENGVLEIPPYESDQVRKLRLTL